MVQVSRPARRAAFSICAPNYLARVATLMESIARHMPDHDRHVVLAADGVLAGDEAALPPGTRAWTPAGAAVPDLEARRSLYNVTEFCTAIKPDVIQWLWGEGYDEIVYFDPDVELLAPPEEIASAWRNGAEVLLTPHLVTTDEHPEWVLRAVAVSGQFNLGFIAVRAGSEARRLVAWWRERIAWNCVEDAGNGVFVDQKVIDHFPALSDAVRVARHPGYNVAYWNIHERPVTFAGGVWSVGEHPLVFFHFSGFEMFGAGMSRHSPRRQPVEGALEELMRRYGRRLVAHGELAHALRPYDYDRTLASVRPSPFLRRALHRALAQGEARPIDLLRADWLFERVPATPDLPYGGTVPRLLQLLRRHGRPPASAEPLFADYLDGDVDSRRRTLPPLLEALHALGAVDAATVERLVATPAGPSPIHGRAVDLVWPVAIEIDDATSPIRLPALPILLHRARSDLAASFDLATRSDVIRFLAWFLSTGLGGWTAAPDTIDAIGEALDQPQPPGDDDEIAPGTLLDLTLHELFAPDAVATRARPSGALALIALLDGVRPSPIRPALARLLRAWLWRRVDGHPARILRLLAASSALRERLFGARGRRRITVSAIEGALATVGLAELARPPLPQPAASLRPAEAVDGPIVIGPFGTTSGVGHSAQRVVATLAAAGLQTRTVDLLATATANAREFAAPPTAGAPGLLVLHANADVTLDTIVKFEPLWRSARRRVGYWYWELATMTRRMAAPAMLLDEIWVATTFVRDAVAPVVDCPVRVCPPLLRSEDFEPSTSTGGSFGVGKKGFRFLGVVDTRSFTQRKNPEGIVRAFRHAFPDGDEPVELLVKLSNAQHDPSGLAGFRALAAGDRRVRVLEGTFSDIEMNDLYRSADCFVSLHRSEGLGLGIAQAMMLGQPVVATGYSGPMDFMAADTAFLVPFRLVPLGRDAYPEWLGQHWAEPDERAAAVYMKEIARNPAVGQAVGGRAAAAVRRHFATERVTALMTG